jgi:cobalamin biosynthetic protein CobC
VPAETWQRLPEDNDGLEAAAREYYGSDRVLMLPGSQAAIQWLPRLFAPGRVAMPEPLYNEHPAAWRRAGHELVAWNEAGAGGADYAVLCNPNNPTGRRFDREELLARARRLRLLVVDEAFIDAEPGESLAAVAGADAAPNVVVLRSLGKFFGLAGARVGCAIAAPELLQRLRQAQAEAVGPWPLSQPARWAARLALADRAWQAAQRQRLLAASRRLATLLQEAGLETTGTALFRYAATPRAAAIHEALARQGILLRRFEAQAATPAGLRFGLPGREGQWRRLADTIKELACAA